MQIKKKIRALKEQLLSQRREILEGHLAQSPMGIIRDEPSTGDAADAASINDLKEQTLNLKESEKRALGVIEEALSRIEAGTYGLCEECGEPIPEKRLLALPHAKYCRDCQEMLERERV